MTAVPWGVPFFILPLIALIDTLLSTCINLFIILRSRQHLLGLLHHLYCGLAKTLITNSCTVFI
jgi:hypothetical protein